MKVTVKGFITNKQGELYSDCRDNYACNFGKNSFAISDGVSKSFFPGIWSELLVNEFVKGAIKDEGEFIKKCQQDWYKEVAVLANSPTAKYFTRNAFVLKKPAMATFASLQFSVTNKTWFSIALGDSLMIFLPKKYEDFGDGMVINSSIPEPIEFNNFPDYFSSIGNEHNGSRQEKSGPLEEGTFYLLTDALAEWFLKNKSEAVREIDLWTTQENFEESIASLRNKGELNNDDSSILVLRTENDKSNKITYDKLIISNLRDLIEIQNKQPEAPVTEGPPGGTEQTMEWDMRPNIEEEETGQENVNSSETGDTETPVPPEPIAAPEKQAEETAEIPVAETGGGNAINEPAAAANSDDDSFKNDDEKEIAAHGTENKADPETPAIVHGTNPVTKFILAIGRCTYTVIYKIAWVIGLPTYRLYTWLFPQKKKSKF